MILVELKKSTILWSVIHLGKYAICRNNDNSLIFNWMLGCDIVLYNDVDNKWQ